MIAPKSKFLTVEINEFGAMAAVTSSFDGNPVLIESLKEFSAPPTADKIRDFVADAAQIKGKGLAMSRCSVFPSSRFLRLGSIETPGKAKDPNFYLDFLRGQVRINPEEFLVAVVNVFDGMPAGPDRNMNGVKDVLFFGAKRHEMESLQDEYVSCGLYPDRFELGSSAHLGGLKNYLKFKDIKHPLLILELSNEFSHIYVLTQERVDLVRPVSFGLNSLFPVIQAELGLKDEESARKLFYSYTFDFSEMGVLLLKRLIKEVQAAAGYYEVQTGQTIGNLILPLLPRSLGWIEQSLGTTTGLDPLVIDYPAWLKSQRIETLPDVRIDGLEARWMGLFSLFANNERTSL